MTIHVQLDQPAAPGTRFDHGAFDRYLGSLFPFHSPGEPPQTGRLMSAIVADDGLSVSLVVELGHEPVALQMTPRKVGEHCHLNLNLPGVNVWNHDHNKPLITLNRDDAVAVMDLVATSLDMQSGMLETSDVQVLRRVAAQLGLNPELWTPNNHPHLFVLPPGSSPEVCGRPGWCGKPADDPIHVKEGP